MKKFITTLCLIFSLLFAFSSFGCGSANWKVGYTKGTVDSNGGFAVTVGDYAYLINGVGDSTAKNSYGTPVKGSLIRVKTSELSSGMDAESAEVVVPKLFTSGFYGTDVGYQTGLTIFGDYVYYGSPNTEKNKTGSIKNNEIVFQKTKLDGTSTTKIATLEGLATEYRFSQVGGKVYLTAIERIAGSSDSDPATYNIHVYNENGTEIFKREGADSLILPYEFDGKYMFYTDLEKDEDDSDKKYGNIYVYEYGKEGEKILLSGRSAFYGGADAFGVQGRTYIVDKYIDNVLYFSYLSADSTDGTTRQYCFYDLDKGVDLTATVEKDATDEAKKTFEDTLKANNPKNLSRITAMGGSTNVAKAILPTALYKSSKEIYYFDKEIGVVVYDYTKQEEAPYFGVFEKVGISKIDIDTPTFKCFIGDFAYFTDKDNFVYRINYNDAAAELEQVSTVAIKTDWYFPEVIGNELLACVSGEPYSSYVHAFNLNIEADAKAYLNEYYAEEVADTTSEIYEIYNGEADELIEYYLKEIADKEENAIKYTAAKRVGVLSKADKKAINKYFDNLASGTTSTSSTSSSN